MRRAVLMGAVAVAGLMGAAPASAHKAPDGCDLNALNLQVAISKTLVRQGDTLTFTVGAQNESNPLGVACHITDASIGIRLPGANGRFVPASTPTWIRTGATLNAPFTLQAVASFGWVVKLDPSLAYGQAQAVADGTLHLTTFDPDRATATKDVSFEITNPVLQIDKVGSIEAGLAPQNVTYTFVVTNTSTTPVPMSKVRVSDDKCGSPTYAGGDNGDGKLSNGEKWTYTCAMLHQDPGVYTNTAYACAESDVDKRDVCSPPDTWTVTLTPPPSNPPASPPPSSPPAETAVKPANATQAPCTLSTPKGLQVRAKELTSIKATVRQVDAGTTVKITLPGGKTVSAKTNSKGVAILKVRPPKTGTARITVAECSEVQRLTVRAARKTQSRRVPRVTG